MSFISDAVSAVPIVGPAVDSVLQGMNNRASRKWSEGMYERQKDDNIAFWNMQNTYNSPEAQMQRFESAGLNKNLIYGRGDSGLAGQVASPQPQRPDFRAPTPGRDVAANIAQFQNMELAKAQTSNVAAQTLNHLETANLIRAQTRDLTSGANRKDFDLDFAREMRGTQADAMREALRQVKVTTDVTLSRNEREAALNKGSLEKMAEEVLTIRLQRANTNAERSRIHASIENLKEDTRLKQLDINLKKSGIQPNDPMYLRILGQYLNSKGASIPQVPNLKKGYNDWLQKKRQGFEDYYKSKGWDGKGNFPK